MLSLATIPQEIKTEEEQRDIESNNEKREMGRLGKGSANKPRQNYW